MKNIFNLWFQANYPGTKSEWAYKVHTRFLEWYNKTHTARCHVTDREIRIWLNKLDIIIIDRKGKTT